MGVGSCSPGWFFFFFFVYICATPLYVFFLCTFPIFPLVVLRSFFLWSIPGFPRCFPFVVRGLMETKLSGEKPCTFPPGTAFVPPTPHPRLRPLPLFFPQFAGFLFSAFFPILGPPFDFTSSWSKYQAFFPLLGLWVLFSVLD